MPLSKHPFVMVLLFLFTLPLGSQQTSGGSATSGACPNPLLSSGHNDRNLFNDQQEEWLGEIMDQGMRKDFHIIEDPDGYLERLGERLLAQLPPTTIHYHFVIIDSPGLNSFGLTGGRIYIYRRMIAFAKSEDELAALVGHEIGHMVTHQIAIQVSDLFRQLAITSVGDRQDVFNKWNQFKDNVRKIKHGPLESMQQVQLVADRVGLYAMTRAGYDPAQFAAFADRSLETKGKMGNFWTDFFGATSPESKRLREIVRNAAPLPAGCVLSRPDTSGFAKWQQSVIQAKAEVPKEELPGLVKKILLRPPLRNELTHLQFSPDGKYLMAQDDSSIFVLTREPFANLFRIDAPDANEAQFTTDSNFIVFDDKEMRVQKWEIASQRQVSMRELSANCKDALLSPSGDVMACVRPDRELQLVEVSSGEVIFAKKNFFDLTPFEELFERWMEILGIPGEEIYSLIRVQLHFSPDSRYLIAAHGNYSLGYDLKARSEVKLPSKVRDLVQSNFVFTAPDELFGVRMERSQKAIRLHFPHGDVIDEFPFFGRGQFSPTVRANYVMVRPSGSAAIGALDLDAKKVAMGYMTLGFAIYDNIFAGDDLDGSLRLCKLADRSVIGKVTLPGSPLARAKASAFSSDGRWLAISGRNRSALWNLETGNRVGYSEDFEGAFFDKDNLIVRLPRRLKQPGEIDSITPSPLSSTKLYELEPPEDKSHALGTPYVPQTRIWQDGDLLIRLAPSDPKKFDRFSLEVHDVRNNATLWQLQLDRYRPRFFYLRSGQTITFVVGDYDKIKEAARQDSALSARVAAIGSKQGKQASYLLQVIEARSQKPLGNVLVDTGNLSFRVENAVAAGNNVFISDSLNRTLVYALKSGDQRGKVFGNALATTENGDRVLVENGFGNVDLYDSASLQSVEHFMFPSRVARAEFTSPDNLFVLTADQTVYQFRVSMGSEKASAR